MSPSIIPPMTPELKSIAPYLQRAEELRHKDPVMAYWSAYYAAQIGISLKAKDIPSRNILFDLLGTLEMMKREIGPNDTVDIEAVSSAYVENFALQVFATADNEDRRGDGNRSTAKKFLAAAHFLEILKVFPKTEISQSNEAKIRYAKWKAADIVKAYREGRNPIPGPAVSVIDSPQSSNISLTQPSLHFPASSSPPKHISIPARRSSTSIVPDITASNEPETPPRRPQALDVPAYESGLLGMGLGMGVGESTPGSWSTVATPGTALGTPMVPMERSDISDIEKTVGAVFGWEEPSSSAPMAGEWSGSDRSERAATSVSGSGRSSLRSTKGWVSDAAPVYAVEEFYPQDPTISNPSLDLKAYSTHNHGDEKKAEYATLTMDTGPVDEAKIARSTPADYGIDTANVSGRRYEHQGNVSGSSTTRTDVPGRAQTSSPMDHQPETHVSLSESSTHPSTRFRSGSNAGSFTRRSPDYTPHQPLPPIPPPFLHPAPPITYAASAPRAPPGSLGLRSEIELTPNLVAKAQKHCRFAISALDYEDAEQAKKELRAALAVLGG